ncbi:hypothetical protein [Caenispirillum bisanense]|uniref:hypothetical protein n=1 Tax=Caenispirillum bisanense TaxID=414052 RepID=UPI0031D8F18A
MTCLLPMWRLTEDAAGSRRFLHHLLNLTQAEAAADPQGHPQAPALLAEALALWPDLERPIHPSARLAAYDLDARIEALQPGRTRIAQRAIRRRGSDGRLLLAENYLAAVYCLEWPWGGRLRCGVLPGGPSRWWFYRACAHFVAAWERQRFILDDRAIPRLRTILEWWEARDAEASSG